MLSNAFFTLFFARFAAVCTMVSRAWVLLAVGLSGLLCCVCVTACVNDRVEVVSSQSVVERGDTLPIFEVRLSNGQIVNAQHLKGRVAVIVFFHTGCPDCQRYLPVLNGVYRDLLGDEAHRWRDVVFVPISRAQPEEEVAAYWKEKRYLLPYSAQTDRRIYEQFARARVPRTYVVGKDGRIAALFDDTNSPSAEELKRTLERLLPSE